MHVLTVCYGHPTDPAAFDAHYTSTHVPLAEKIPGMDQLHPPPLRVARRLAAALLPDRRAQLRPPRRRWAPPWRRPRPRPPSADVPNFATGGVTMFIAYD